MAVGAIALGAGAVVGQHGGHRCAAAMALEDRLQQRLQLGARARQGWWTVRTSEAPFVLEWLQRNALTFLNDSYLSNIDLMTENIHFLPTPEISRSAT
jgi:hypothetical protein